MHRLPSILAPALALAALAIAPAAALAQTFPASAVVAVSVHSLGPDTRAFALNDRDAAAQWRPPATQAAPLPTARPQPLKLQPRIAFQDVDAPQVDIRPKAEWSDNQGLRATPTRVTYKQRF